MSYTSTDLITYAVGDGTTGTIQTPPFEVDSDIVVLVRESGESTADTWVLDTDYTLSGAGTGANGTLTPITTKPDGSTIVIYTDPAPTLTFDFSSLPTALQSPLTSALHQIQLQVRSLKAAQRQYIRTSLFDLVAKNNAGTVAVDASRLGKLLLWNASTGAPDVIATDDFIGPAGQPGAGATPDGRTILEVETVTDSSAEFLSGATFTLDPTNARHYNIQVGDSETALTAGMTIDLAPDSLEWPETAQVIISKGDSSAYSVTIYGLNVNGLGTTTLSEQYEGVILGYHNTDGENGPGAAGQKWKPVARFTRTRSTISKTAAAWTADATTVLADGQIGRESDTGEIKFGNGSDLWSGLDYFAGSDGSTPVTLARTQPAARTASFTLGADQTTTALDDQELLIDRKVAVDPAAAVDITLNSALDVGTKWEIHVADEDYAVTLVREAPQISFVGDVENGSAIITNIGDKTGIENGYTIDETYFPGSTTVVDKDHGASSIQVSANATGVTTEDADLTLDAGKQGTINGVQGDLLLRKGVCVVELTGKAFGADVIVRGDIAGGGGPFTQGSITATGNTDMAGAHFGKSNLVTPASGTPTFTFLTEANYGASIPAGTWMKFWWDGTATSFTFVQGSGTTLHYDADQTLAMKAKGVVTAEYLGSEAWALSGGLILA